MTEAGWTREKPTAAGWYWLKRVGAVTVVKVIAVPGYEPKHWIVEGVNLRWSLCNMDGEWLGPLSPTDQQQGRAEGLREAIEVAEKCKNQSALGPVRDTYSYIEDTLRRLAQDEKGVGDVLK